MLNESEIDKRIKKFRKKLDKELGNKNLEKINKKKFRNPTNDKPIRTAEFLSYLDVSPFKKNLK